MTYMLTRTKIKDVREGDLIDVATLPFAAEEYDPANLIHFEYGEVYHLSRETDSCVVVDTSVSAFAASPDHEVERMVPLS